MDYTEAVRLAKAGEDKGFNFLYEETYKSKYYLALQYMKNEEAAKDVLQEAYMKAFSKLDMLEKPEAFSGWLGTIVGNTAKNMLVKKNPMLFSDIAVNDEDESFEYQIEDDNVEYQPETAYTRQETQELVHELMHELMDTLSEEQRMCLLMFHIEGTSIKEIAATLDCSENTVKSRLNYGRKNIKVKAEELQKKGYKLYSLAPLPLLLYLLRVQEGYLLADGTLQAAGEHMAEQIFRSLETTQSTGMSSVAQEAAKNSAKTAAKAAKNGFIHTTAGKITVVVVGLCIVGGGVFYGLSQMDSNDPVPETEIVSEQDEIETDESSEEPIAQEESEPEQEEIDEDAWIAAYEEILMDAPNQTYIYEDLTVVEPYINYMLLDMEGDDLPELILTVSSSAAEDVGVLSFRNSLVYIYSYSEDAGAQMKEEYVYYMPGFARDENNNLIISERTSPVSPKVTYYSVKMENGSLRKEEIYYEEFIYPEDNLAFNEEHGFVGLESSEIDDLTLLLKNGDSAKLDEYLAEKKAKEEAEKNTFTGTYTNGQGESQTISEDGQMKIIRWTNEYDVDLNTGEKQEDGSILAYKLVNGNGDTVIRLYVYPAGIPLSAPSHDYSTLEETDSNKNRLYFTYSDAPNIKSNVYYQAD
ncbi:MAG: sigma-70 family RNA polymerase sigma factor [Clostridiaceae bacterium]|nr:sigma-70 family RNA polymerase sigma factor [Clostridiaceae bacterium]